jgi:predicted small secreted protein
MKRLLYVLLVLVLAVPLSGCGGEKDKGIHKDNKDRPREAPAESK